MSRLDHPLNGGESSRNRTLDNCTTLDQLLDLKQAAEENGPSHENDIFIDEILDRIDELENTPSSKS